MNAMDDHRTSGGRPQRVAVYTLGCRLNQAETRLLEERLRRTGFDIVPFGQAADIGVVHTCVVTREAEAKSRKAVRRFIRENPGAITAVIGCYAQTAGAAIAQEAGVSLVLGNEAKWRLPEQLRDLSNGATVLLHPRPARRAFRVPFAADGPPITRRAHLKIQDGCDFMCSYCYIPFARGRARSRVYSDILEEAGALVRRGARELVLCGVNLGTYACRGRNLCDVLDALNRLRPVPRLRISSIELTAIPEGILERMADPGHALVPHLHVPLQSASDRILARMRRPYQASDYLAFVERAASLVPDVGCSADVMTGFPGEDDDDFQATYDLIRNSPLFHLHVFPYSERDETASARFPEKTPIATVQDRTKRLRQLGAIKKHAFLGRFVGRRIEVLFESGHNGVWTGHAGNYVEVRVRSAHPLENRLLTVEITGMQDQYLEGEPAQ